MGWWKIVAQMGMSAGSNYAEQQSNALQNNQGILWQNAQQIQGMQQQQASNDAMLEANTQNTIIANYKAGLIQMQQGQALKQDAQQMTTLSQQGLIAQGNANTMAAAAGSIGNSVHAVTTDLQKQLGDALIQVQTNADIQKMQFQDAMKSNYQSLYNAIQIPVVSTVTDFSAKWQSPNAEYAAWYGILSTLGQYGSDYMGSTPGSSSDSGGGSGGSGGMGGMMNMFGGSGGSGGGVDASSGSSFMGSVE